MSPASEESSAAGGPEERPERHTRALLIGLLLGLGALLVVWLTQEKAFVEREEFFPPAAPEELAAWTAQWETRATPWLEVPDPPGTGPVERRRYWLSRWSYDLEIRRRGDRVVIAVAGVAPHQYGGGWASFGEGRITGAAGPLGSSWGGAVATFSWSCLGVRYRHASDGVGRLVFDESGDGLVAIYMAWEAPALWAKAYGRRRAPEEAEPPFGSLRGQIPYTPALSKLSDEERYQVRVRVLDDEGAPVRGARVGLKGRRDTQVVSDAEGRVTLSFLGAEAPWAQVFGAGVDGHRNSEVAFLSGDAWPGLRAGAVAEHEVEIVLPRVDLQDHSEYVWAHASPTVDPDDVMACGTCHPWHHDQWIESRHARMADNGHVTWERNRMRTADPEAPDDCHGCHQPAHAAQEPGNAWRPRGMEASNHCDFCHKIAALTDAQASGMLGGYRLARPDPGAPTRPGSIQHVFGTASDATYAYMGATYNALFEDGHLCAGCHQGGGRHEAGGLAKVDTYAEWQAWLAALEDPAEGRSCQDCHMPAGGMRSSAGVALDQMAWDALHRRPEEIHGHRFLGTEPALAGDALDVKVVKTRDMDSGLWNIVVSVTNTGAGHKIPTGTWSKRVIVGVWASAAGAPLLQVDGDRTWLDPAAPVDVAYAPGDWRNPGGLVLGMRAASDPEGRQTAPPFWQVWRSEDVIDTRLAPGETRSARLLFEDTPKGIVPQVEVRILYRRARLARGLASLPWTLRTYDPAPEVLWKRVVR
jgi:hypothetical protein